LVRVDSFNRSGSGALTTYAMQVKEDERIKQELLNELNHKEISLKEYKAKAKDL